MKKKIFYLFALIFSMTMTSCENTEPVDPTAQRQGITSMTVLFNSGPNKDKELTTFAVSDPEATEFVIPIPWYYPEESDDITEQYMESMRLKLQIANNCLITPPVSILNLNKENYFVFTDPQGKSRKIMIRGERVHSDKCAIMTFVVNPLGLSGVIDEDDKTISLITADDLSACTIDATLSPHATLDVAGKVINLNEETKVTVTADNGTTTAVYTVKKQIPPKLDSGIRKGSEKQLFNVDLNSLGVTSADAIHPTLAATGNYVILNLGDGSNPMYLNKATGSKIGTINLGSAKATGSVASDIAGNVLICNYAKGGETLKIYKTNSVTQAPKEYITYNYTFGTPGGSRMHIQGDLDQDAIITVTCDGPGSRNFIRWMVKGGVVGSPQMYTVNVTNGWNGLDGNTKVVARTTNPDDGYFLSYYDGGANNLYFCVNENPVATLSGQSSGSGWGYNNSSMDTRVFNGVSYTTLYAQGYWPDWGLTGTIYMYTTNSTGSFTGTVDTSPALYYTTTIPAMTSIPYAGDGRTGDLLMSPSKDGYKLGVYYVSNTDLVVGGVEFDCIAK